MGNRFVQLIALPLFNDTQNPAIDDETPRFKSTRQK